jgi:hypothetical protein
MEDFLYLLMSFLAFQMHAFDNHFDQSVFKAIFMIVLILVVAVLR